MLSNLEITLSFKLSPTPRASLFCVCISAGPSASRRYREERSARVAKVTFSASCSQSSNAFEIVSPSHMNLGGAKAFAFSGVGATAFSPASMDILSKADRKSFNLDIVSCIL